MVDTFAAGTLGSILVRNIADSGILEQVVTVGAVEHVAFAVSCSSSHQFVLASHSFFPQLRGIYPRGALENPPRGAQGNPVGARANSITPGPFL